MSELDEKGTSWMKKAPAGLKKAPAG